MEVSLAVQSQSFLFSCIVGFALGAFYDIFRILRILCKTEKRHVFFQDIFFMACAAIVTFLLALAVNWGEIRFYIIAGEIIGLCVYYLTVGEVTIRIAKLIYKVLFHVFLFLKKLFILPVIRLFLHIGRWVTSKCNKIIKFRKKNNANSKNPLKHHYKVVYNNFISFCTGKGGMVGGRHNLHNESYQKEKTKR